MIRLSLLAESNDKNPCDTALTRVGLIRRNLTRLGYAAGDWCFTMERNPKGTGYHAHCLQRGPSIPQEVLQEACMRSRAGIPYINAIKRQGIWTSRYGMKGFGADGYGLKTFRPNADSREALRINNGRMEHHSRGFFAIEGDSIGVRPMERLAIAAMSGENRTAYIGAASTEVDRILGSAQMRESLIRATHRHLCKQLRSMA
jgi:hypothetical protein